MRLQLYYKKHLRSLFLSKFIYFTSSKIIKFFGSFLTLGFKKEKIDFSLGYLFLFLVSQSSPFHNIKFFSVRGKKKFKFGEFVVKFQEKFFFVFLEKLVNLYFVSLENWVGVLKNLILFSKFKNYFYLKITDFSIFPELDFLVNFNFPYLKNLSQKWYCSFFFKYKNCNKHEFTTLLRSLEVPIFTK